MIIIRHYRRVHFIGIGGIGMSALAECLLSHGFQVSGSDSRTSPITTRLESLGARIQYDHVPLLVKDADLVVYSSAIREQNPEWMFAKSQGLRIMRRAEMLGEFMRMKFSIGVAGTHGKTTTTSLIGQVLQRAGRHPTVLVGGILKSSGSNALMDTGELMVVEADEYDRSFLRMYPSIAVITSIEPDHLDCYSDIDDIKTAFMQYMNSTPFYGAVVACIDEPNVREVLNACDRPVVTYGLDHGADYSARDVSFEPQGARFTLYRAGKSKARLELPLPGIHNVKNACAACAVALELGVDINDCAAGLSSFSGVNRRFEVKGLRRSITVVDDYAHHPTEISATLAAAKSAGFNRIVAIFQPHLYTRTRDFLEGFAHSLRPADIVVVTGIYKSREDPIPGVTASAIVERLRSLGHGHVFFIENKGDVVERIAPMLQEGDVVITLGAGDINDLCDQLLSRLDNA